MTPVKALNEQKSTLPLYLCCVRCLSKARTKFQSDFHRRTNRFKRKTRRTKINVIKTKWMQKKGNEGKEKRKYGHEESGQSPSPFTPSSPTLASSKQKKDEFDESLLQYFCLVYWLKNVSKSNYSALLLTANDEVHTHSHTHNQS